MSTGPTPGTGTGKSTPPASLCCRGRGEIVSETLTLLIKLEYTQLMLHGGRKRVNCKVMRKHSLPGAVARQDPERRHWLLKH